ncbi:MAG TPA: hypothetical protein VGZ26_11340 [Pirellulales bacterium]|nr:hypothetical protein [Pirellulales bacterium]
MRQRIAVGTVGVAVVLCILLLWGATRPVSAIAQMAENIRRAKSFKVTINTEFTPTREVQLAPQTLTIYWLAPGSYRMEGRDATAHDSTNISPAGKPGIDINHRTKTFQRKSAVLGNISGLEMFDELSTFSGQADRDLGAKQVNGKEARGFEIDSKKINPDGPLGRMEIWLDLESNLPLLVRWQIADSVTPGTMTWQDFHWNIDLDPKLFDPTPPAGYTDATRPPPPLDEQVGQVIEALKIYAELTGGHFPRGKMVYGDVTRDEMYRMIGIKGFPTPEQVRTEQYVQVVRSGLGFARLNGVLANNPDAAYYGKTVGPKDSGKVLLRWRLEDRSYQVIFGDLRAEIVTKERLAALEGGK